MAKANVLDRAQILKAAALKTIDVDVPRLGGPVKLKEPAGSAVIAFQKQATGVGEARQSALLLALCWVDEAGAPMFPGDDGAAEIEGFPAEVLLALLPKAAELCGLGDEATEGAVKN